jgi:hydroxyacylglutathione hydrolase
MKRALKIGGVVLGALAIGIAVFLYAVLGGKAPIPGGLRIDGVEVVKDGYVSAYLVDLGPGEVALVDSGSDTRAEAILAALRSRGLGPEAVTAILLTHGDADHIGGAHVFPRAEVMALGPEVDLVEGRTVRGPFVSPHSTGIQVARDLTDGDAIDLGGVRFEVFAVPGHTPGSVAFLARGVLFLGDSAEFDSSDRLVPANWFFCGDRPTNRRSLQQLATRLEPRAADVRAIACSHSGVQSRGLTPLAELARRLRSDAGR